MTVEFQLQEIRARLRRLEEHLGLVPVELDTPLARWRLIAGLVGLKLGFAVEEIEARARPASLAWARQICLTLAHEMIPLSANQLSRLVNRDRHTIFWAKRAVANRCDIEPDWRLLLDSFRAQILSEINRRQQLTSRTHEPHHHLN